MNSHRTHAAVEIVDHIGKGAEKVGTAKDSVRVARAISGSEAFRKYEWLKAAPVNNVVGTFREWS